MPFTDVRRFLGCTMPASLVAIVLVSGAMGGSQAAAQVVYETLRPVPYVANYVPSGNYAAVTAFSPPVVSGVPVVAGYAPVSAPVVATVPSSSLAVTSYYAPVPVAAAPVTTFYAPTFSPAAVPVTSYYAPSAEVVAPVVAPVAAYYPPTMSVRRGLFGNYRYRYNPGVWYTPY